MIVGENKTQVVYLNNCKIMPKTETVTVSVDTSQPINEPNIALEEARAEAEVVKSSQVKNLFVKTLKINTEY